MSFVAAPAGSGWGLFGMTSASWSLLAVASVFALGDWVSVSGVAPATRRAEYVCKPATLLALIGVAATLSTPDPARRAWFVVALVFCLVGDILLMLPASGTATFGAGLGSFLLAQVCFIVGITNDGGGWSTTVVAFVVLGILAAAPATLVVRSVGRSSQPWLRTPVLLYLGALVTMAATAWSAGFGGAPSGRNALVALGGVCFVVSDTLLSLDRFVRPLARGTLWVHMTYHVAVALLVLSLAGSA